jgi:hypothetical protein
LSDICEIGLGLIRERNPGAKRLCVEYLAVDGNVRKFYEKCGFVVDRIQEFDGWSEEIAYYTIG